MLRTKPEFLNSIQEVGPAASDLPRPGNPMPHPDQYSQESCKASKFPLNQAL